MCSRIDYRQWRAARSREAELREQDEAHPPRERLLQQVWLHQRLRRDDLRTVDGLPVVVLHPGFWNREAGPDFRHAVVQIGDPPARVGDVEVDVVASGWCQHQHEANPAYRNVVLHVIWDAPDTTIPSLPTLALRPWIDTPPAELEGWLGGLDAGEMPVSLRGACGPALAQLSAPEFEELLHQAAQVRLEQKAARFQSRARQAGWEQALWEGLFAALGYKHNVWPLRRLAELLPRVRAAEDTPCPSAHRWEVLLLGLAGLLPSDWPQASACRNQHLVRLWDEWWRDRAGYAEDLVPGALWRFHGIRPANHPARRLALAAQWLADPAWPERLAGWLTAEIPPRRLATTLLEGWRTVPHEFWSWHWTLRSKRLARPQPWLGHQRVTDLAINVVLPWLWSRAHTGGNPALAARAENRYFAWPAAQDNAVLRLARQRVLAGLPLPKPPCASQQQALLQIVRDFCDRSNALCQDCPFPNLVRGAGADAEGKP